MLLGHMATFPARAATLEQVIARVAPQLDKLKVVLNEYEQLPVGNFPANVEFIFPDCDLKDVGKFLPSVDASDTVFLLDDDILYPDDYVTNTLQYMDGEMNRAIFGYHGSTYLMAAPTLNPMSWYGTLAHMIFGGNLRKLRTVFHFQKNVSAQRLVDQLGSGVSAMRGSAFPPFEVMQDSAKFTDVRLASWAYENSVKMVCLPHKADWLKTVSYEDDIFRSFTRRTPVEILAEIKTFAGKAHRMSG